MKERTVIVRAVKELLDQYKERHPEMRGLTYAGIADLMLRRLIQIEEETK